ncbi:MAG: hypothetical protein FOGNACKC_00948 [Anaerolineae bacterium]|nr:hypothetical protein [Anaerolineae bacterium]
MVFEIQGQKRYHRQAWCNCLGAQKAKQLQEKQERRELVGRVIGDLWSRAGLTEGKFARMRLGTWDPNRYPGAKRHLVTALEYVQNVRPGTEANWLYIYGHSFGTGKTHLAIGILYEATVRSIKSEKQFWRPLYIDWSAHCSLVQESWDMPKDDPDWVPDGRLWNRMKGADLLVLDDLDKQPPTPWALGKLYQVLHHRYMREKPTIFTSQQSLEELKRDWSGPLIARTGGATVSRIIGQLWGAMEVIGPDQREE